MAESSQVWSIESSSDDEKEVSKHVPSIAQDVVKKRSVDSSSDDEKEVINGKPKPGNAKVWNKNHAGNKEINQISPAPKKRKESVGKMDGLTLNQHKRMLGDLVKAKLEVAGGREYHIKARCHVTTQMSLQVFKALVVPAAACLTPSVVNHDTEVRRVRCKSSFLIPYRIHT